MSKQAGEQTSHQTRGTKQRMELNTDWIDKHLTGTTPAQLTGVMFYQIEAAQPRPEVRSN